MKNILKYIRILSYPLLTYDQAVLLINFMFSFTFFLEGTLPIKLHFYGVKYIFSYMHTFKHIEKLYGKSFIVNEKNKTVNYSVN